MSDPIESGTAALHRQWPPTAESSMWDHLRSLPKQESAFACANNFMRAYLTERPEAKDNLEVALLFRDIEVGRFWGIIDKIDGAIDYQGVPGFERGLSEEKAAQKREESRAWAREHFTPDQLQELFGIYMTMVFSAPDGTVAAPGSDRPSSIAYNQIVNKPGSMFADQITPEMRKTLNNRRFWEEFASLRVGIGNSHRVINEVLTQHFDELDPNFAPEGLKIVKKIHEKNWSEEPKAELDYLSVEAIDKYAEFMDTINQQRDALGISQEQMVPLVRPYFNEILAISHEDEFELRFGHHYDYKTEKYTSPKRDCKTRLSEPLIREFLPMFVDAELVSTLKFLSSRGHNDVIQAILAAHPSPEEIIDVAEKIKGGRLDILRDLAELSLEAEKDN
jgi:hypothetical protein